MRLRMYRRNLALLGIACLLVLLAGGARLLATRGPEASGSTVALSLWPGRTLSVDIWLRDSVATFWPDASGSAVRGGTHVIKNPGSITVALWLQDTAASSTTRLAMMKLPPWPLLLLTAACAAAVYRLRPAREET